MDAPAKTSAADAHAGQRAPSTALRDTRTHENLRTAFATDAQAVRLWASFGRIAEIEGFPEVARTFRELADSQNLYADGHLDFLMRAGEPLTGLPVGETAQNLRAALAAQRQGAQDSLPDMARTARAEGFMDIASWFDTIGRSRVAHAARLDEALAPFRGENK